VSDQETAVIIGASTGMGRATAQLLAAQGHNVTLVSRNTDRLEATRADIAKSASGEINAYLCDLADPTSVSALVAFLDGHAGHISRFLNASGIFAPKPFLDHDERDYDSYHALNRAAFFATQAVARNMIKHGGGSIVTIGSMWAKQAIKATPSSAYSMAKAGLHAMTQHSGRSDRRCIGRRLQRFSSDRPRWPPRGHRPSRRVPAF
jgi:short-subunit dehydrogenase